MDFIRFLFAFAWLIGVFVMTVDCIITCIFTPKKSKFNLAWVMDVSVYVALAGAIMLWLLIVANSVAIESLIGWTFINSIAEVGLTHAFWFGLVIMYIGFYVPLWFVATGTGAALLMMPDIEPIGCLSIPIRLPSFVGIARSLLASGK